MSDDLVKRLRSIERDLNNGFPMTCERGEVMQQAAARIEKLEAALREIRDEPCMDPDGNSEIAAAALQEDNP